MKNIVISIEDETSWPTELVSFFDANNDIFYSRETSKGYDYRMHDIAILNLEEILNNYLLHGYHCTRLTEREINRILKTGMSLPSLVTLNNRIQELVEDGIITEDIANRLKSTNQADEESRANMIWFCFYLPHIASEWGIRRFFRSWGGEALYNSHERIPETGPSLNRIGIPCVVEALVPIRSLKIGFLSYKIARQYLKNRGLKTKEPMDHDGAARTNIPPSNIIGITRFPEQKFIDLTRCDRWKVPLIV